MDLNAHRWRDKIKLEPLSSTVSVRNGLVRMWYCENRASIFVLRNSVDIYQKYKYLRTITTSPHENVQAFFGMKKDGENYLFAFEPVFLTLADYMRLVPVEELRPHFLLVLRGIIEGLKHIHQLGLVHGDINPWNTYVWNGKFKFGGYNDWKSLTSSCRGLDYDAVAKLIAYIFSFHALHDHEKDKHQYSKLSLWDFQSKMHRYAKEAYRVVELLSDQNRPADILDRILLETWLWLAERRIVYFKEIQEILFDKHKRRGYHMNTAALQSKLSTCWDSGNADGWSDCFSPLLMAEKNSYHEAKKEYEYDIWEGKELIRFIRNLYGHHFEYGGDMENICKLGGLDHKLEDLGESVEDLEFLIRRTFPKLLVELHREVRRQGLHTKAKLKPFY